MKLSIITDLTDLNNVYSDLSEAFEVTYLPNCSKEEFLRKCSDCEVIFTNPNNAKFPLNGEVLGRLASLKIITTASTGTVHIDKEFCLHNDIKVLAITDERDTLQKISSTAEHAVLLTLTLLRKTHLSTNSVWAGEWDYSEFIGRQVNQLKIGTLGLGRLGTMYLQTMKAMGAEVHYYDPYKKNKSFISSSSLK